MKFDHKRKLLFVGITSPKHGIVKLKKIGLFIAYQDQPSEVRKWLRHTFDLLFLDHVNCEVFKCFIGNIIVNRTTDPQMTKLFFLKNHRISITWETFLLINYKLKFTLNLETPIYQNVVKSSEILPSSLQIWYKVKRLHKDFINLTNPYLNYDINNTNYKTTYSDERLCLVRIRGEALKLKILSKYRQINIRVYKIDNDYLEASLLSTLIAK
ncbi:hypothetical protein AGLY_016510, partial [Aphis glycines]